MLKTGSVFVFLYGGNIPFVVSLCFASQRTPTACPCCAGSISTIGLRSFLLKVSGSNSLLSFCCTSLVSGLIIQEEARFVYWQTAQRINLFLCNVKTCGGAEKLPRSSGSFVKGTHGAAICPWRCAGRCCTAARWPVPSSGWCSAVGKSRPRKAVCPRFCNKYV